MGMPVEPRKSRNSFQPNTTLVPAGGAIRLRRMTHSLQDFGKNDEIITDWLKKPTG